MGDKKGNVTAAEGGERVSASEWIKPGRCAHAGCIDPARCDNYTLLLPLRPKRDYVPRLLRFLTIIGIIMRPCSGGVVGRTL